LGSLCDLLRLGEAHRGEVVLGPGEVAQHRPSRLGAALNLDHGFVGGDAHGAILKAKLCHPEISG
jgi:hypothetical protein